jgi:hypothetical protein
VSAGEAGTISSAEGTPREILAGRDGFEIGAIEEGTRVTTHTQGHELVFDDRSAVRVQVQDTADPDTPPSYLGVAVRLDVLAAHVRLPDGSPAFGAGAEVRAGCTAVARATGFDPDHWRSVAVSVRVSVPGCVPVSFVWRAADAPLETLTLVPEPTPPSTK